MKDIREYLRNGRAFRRFLESQVGRPWDQVYHEICQIADPNSRRGHEIRYRIDWNVHRDCFLGEDGVVYETSKYSGPYPVHGLYVHPVTGLLSSAPRPRYGNWFGPRSWEREVDFISLEKGLWYEKVNGGWIKHWIEDRVDTYPIHEYDPVTKQNVYTGRVKEFHEEVHHSRQLDRKESKILLEEFKKYGTNKQLMARVGTYVPMYRW